MNSESPDFDSKYSESFKHSESKKQSIIKEDEKSVYEQAIEARTLLYKAKNKALAQLQSQRKTKGFLLKLGGIIWLVVLLLFLVKGVQTRTEKPEKMFSVSEVMLPVISLSGGGGIIFLITCFNIYNDRFVKENISKADQILHRLDELLF
ncbi:MAG: hypothetical protein NVSMB70_13930 [Chamaesiphon sp.]